MCSLDLLGRMSVYARVSRYGAQVHVARDGGGRQRLTQGRGAWGGAGRVMVLTPGVVDAVRGDVYSEGSNGALEFVGLDVVEACHRPCVGALFADPHGACPRRRWVRCGLWSRGWRVMLWRCFQLWNARRAWRPCLVSPGGRG